MRVNIAIICSMQYDLHSFIPQSYHLVALYLFYTNLQHLVSSYFLCCWRTQV